MRISSKRVLRLMTVAFVLVSAGAGNAYAARAVTTKTDRAVTHSVPQEEVKKMKGVVVKRESDSFTMSETFFLRVSSFT